MAKPASSGSRSGRLVMAAATVFGLTAGLAGGAAWSWRQSTLAADAVATREAAELPARTGPMAREVMLALVRSTLAAVHHANETGNYTVLRDLGAPGFREANAPERLAETFRVQRERRLDLSGTLFVEPVLTVPPRLEPNGMMRVAGHFPAGRVRLEFDLVYQPVDGRWRLYGIATDVTLGERRVAEAGRNP